MSRRPQKARAIGLFVEGYTECGETRRKTLPAFFHNWLDPRFGTQSRVGIVPVRFKGASDYLDRLGRKLESYLDEHKVNFVFGLLDLYGLPSRIDLSTCTTVNEKVQAAEQQIRRLIPHGVQRRFHQHFAVHETEAWLLAYSEQWPANVRKEIEKRPPEQVNFNEPPAKFLKRIVGRQYKKTVCAKNIFPKVDPQIAISKCPYLRRLAEDMLEVARRLQ